MPNLALDVPATPPARVTLVYASGKVGTATMLRALEAALPDEWVGDVRTLAPDGLAELHGWVRATRPRRRPRTHDGAVARLVHANPEMPVRLVTLVRDPVSTAVSSFFWNFELRYPDRRIEALDHDSAVREIAAGGFASRPDYFTGWFARELRPATGIDVYARPFPHAAGFAAFRAGRFELVVVRLEDLDRVYADALAAIGVRAGPLPPAGHRGDRQPYGAAYERFKRRAGLPAGWVDEQLRSACARHFYTRAERELLRERWAG